MNESRTQKILVGIVAVAALGFGGYWVVGSDANSDADKPTKIAISDRKAPATPDVTVAKSVRKLPARRAETPKPK